LIKLQDAKPTVNSSEPFEMIRTNEVINQKASSGDLNSSICGHYGVSKRRNQITNSSNFTSQKKRNPN